jgi:hypothetical protein
MVGLGAGDLRLEGDEIVPGAKAIGRDRRGGGRQCRASFRVHRERRGRERGGRLKRERAGSEGSVHRRRPLVPCGSEGGEHTAPRRRCIRTRGVR